jgi:hypothetical protein
LRSVRDFRTGDRGAVGSDDDLRRDALDAVTTDERLGDVGVDAYRNVVLFQRRADLRLIEDGLVKCLARPAGAGGEVEQH